MTNISPKHIIKYVLKHFPDAQVIKGGEEITLPCPFHHGDSNKLYFNTQRGVYNCFVCGAKGNAYQFIKLTSNETITDEKQSFYDKVVSRSHEKSNPTPIPYPDYYYPLYTKLAGEILAEAREYLYGRKLTDDHINFYKMGVCIAGYYGYRVIVPVLSKDNELMSFVARTITKSKEIPKVLTPPGEGTQGIKRFIYNLYNAEKTRHLILTEGVFSAISCGVSGTAIFGNVATDSQIYSLIQTRPLRITCLLDPDAQAQNEKLANQLTTFKRKGGFNPRIFLATLVNGDPNDPEVSPEELKDTIESAVEYY